jgi:hypothetical protein
LGITSPAFGGALLLSESVMADDNEIVPFPMKSWQRMANRRGKMSVSCVVTDRYLRFAEKTGKIEMGTAVWVDVFTDSSGEERKLCSLAITVEELRRVLDRIPVE